MDATLAALGSLLLRALPTFLLVLVLHFYLKYMFFKPLQRVLDARYAATEGAKDQAARSLERAAAKAKEYEEAIRAARADVYHAQEQLLRQLEEQRGAEVQASRARAEAAVSKARAEIAADVESAKRSLAQESEVLSNQIVDAILTRRPA